MVMICPLRLRNMLAEHIVNENNSKLISKLSEHKVTRVIGFDFSNYNGSTVS